MEGALGIWFAIRPPENGAGTPAVCQTFQDCEQFRRGAGGGTIKVFQSRADAERYAYGVDEIMHSTPVPTTSSLPPPPPQIQFTQPAPPPQLPPVTTWRCTLCNSLETSSITAHQCRREPYITLNALRNPAHFNQPLPPPQIEICEEPTNLTACVSFASQFDIPWCPSGDMAIAVYFDICSPYNTAQYLKHVNTNHNAEVAGVLEAMSIVSQHCLIAPGGLFVLCISSALVKHQFDECVPRWRQNNWLVGDHHEMLEASNWKNIDGTLNNLATNNIRVQLEVIRYPHPASFSAARSLAVNALVESSPNILR